MYYINIHVSIKQDEPRLMVIRVRIVDNENVGDVNSDKLILSLKLNSHYNAI